MEDGGGEPAGDRAFRSYYSSVPLAAIGLGCPMENFGIGMGALRD